MSFQENLRYYREKAGYKQAKDFARILNISYTTYIAYENQGREPKFSVLCKIADLLSVSTDELLGRKNNILGTNEDARLEKEIHDILSISNKKFLRLAEIDDDGVYFYVSNSKGLPISEEYFSKKALIQRINSIRSEAEKYFKMRVYNDVLSFLIFMKIDALDDEVEGLKEHTFKDKEKELLNIQDINCRLEMINELTRTNKAWCDFCENELGSEFVHRNNK